MHDLHVADKIHKLVIEQAQKNNLKQVKSVIIDLGSVIEHGADISSENLEFNLKMLSKNTIAENVKVKINRVDGNSWKLISITGDEK
ncbi:hydrogenase maturation nickel metallochaperone HypA [Candidatus Kuenenbacteria bacterium]|nr:hydrogenase maturation nickel metallochaperone HypA [Candidatus Kuenenbacteria bacterium]